MIHISQGKIYFLFNDTMAKSLSLTYFFWLIGGWLGLHHFYLGRDRHAFLTWSTFCGFFGLGLLRDLIHIPSYVKEANQDAHYMSQLRLKMQKDRTPPYNVYRHIGQTIAGVVWGSALKLSIPEQNEELQWIEYLVPFAIALGVYTTGNVGHIKGSYTWPLFGAFTVFVAFSDIGLVQVSLSSFVSSCVFKARWKGNKPAKTRSVVSRLSYLCVAAAIYSSLWLSFLHFNVRVTDSKGNPVQFPVDDFKLVLRQAAYHFFQQGLTEQRSADEEGRALKILGLSEDATPDEISSQRRKLAMKWHPDLYTDLSQKLEAEAKFAEINESYNKLRNFARKRK